MGSGRGWLVGDWPSTGGVLKIGLRASSDGVLATKSELKMLASTCSMPDLFTVWFYLLILYCGLEEPILYLLWGLVDMFFGYNFPKPEPV